jgi:UDP-3-O-[3-hydroxymyristoyl] glucosamine N-acyltransferase
MTTAYSLDYLASYVGGSLAGDGQRLIRGAASIDEAREDHIAFAEKGAALRSLSKTNAAAVIVPCGTEQPSMNLVLVDHPRLAFAKVLDLFNPSTQVPSGVHPQAIIGDHCEIGGGVAIAPGVVVGNGVTIGDRVMLYPNVTIGDNAVVGDDTIVYPNAAILERCRIGRRVVIHAGAVIGSDGFGFVFDSGSHHKIPQIGIVQIDDDVEIGANTVIDRATIGKTWIRTGVKMDNLIQVGHNVEIGEHSVITAQVGFAGSTTTGRYNIFAGQCGIGGHLTLGDKVTIGPQCAVAQSVPDNQTVSGTTLAMPHGIWLRLQKVLSELPALFKRVQRLEKNSSDRSAKREP